MSTKKTQQKLNRQQSIVDESSVPYNEEEGISIRFKNVLNSSPNKLEASKNLHSPPIFKGNSFHKKFRRNDTKDPILSQFSSPCSVSLSHYKKDIVEVREQEEEEFWGNDEEEEGENEENLSLLKLEFMPKILEGSGTNMNFELLSVGGRVIESLLNE